MKRSKINGALRDTEKMINRCSFKLSPFCYFTLEEWSKKDHEYDEVRDNMLGWDIMDFGMGDFDKMGFSPIILRSGNVSTDKYTRSCARKLPYVKKGQSAAIRFYWNKVEDIINRGGGSVFVGVYNAGREELTDADVRVHSDGWEYTILAGTWIRLCLGESITVQPYLYYDPHLEPGTGPVLLDEVSVCNNDNRDNRFYLPAGRLPITEGDKPPFRLLCSEYPPADSCTKR